MLEWFQSIGRWTASRRCLPVVCTLSYRALPLFARQCPEPSLDRRDYCTSVETILVCPLASASVHDQPCNTCVWRCFVAVERVEPRLGMILCVLSHEIHKSLRTGTPHFTGAIAFECNSTKPIGTKVLG